MKTLRSTNLSRTLCLVLSLAAAGAAHAGPMTVAEMKKRIASLVAGRYVAAQCRGVGSEQPESGVLSISTDGQIVGPTIAVSMFDPAAEMLLQRYVDSDPRVLTVDFRVFVNGQSFDINRVVPSDSPGRLEAGAGQPNANIDRGTACDHVDWSAARITDPSFDFASELAPMFVTKRPVKGSCRSMKHGRSPSRPVQYALDAHGVVVDGVTLPFGSPSQPTLRADIGSRYADHTVNASFGWADGSEFHVEQFIEGDGVTVFSYTLHGKPDAQMMSCTPER